MDLIPAREISSIYALKPFRVARVMAAFKRAGKKRRNDGANLEMRAKLHRFHRRIPASRRAGRHLRRACLRPLEGRPPARCRLRPFAQRPQDHPLRAAPHHTRLRPRRREPRGPGRRRAFPRHHESSGCVKSSPSAGAFRLRLKLFWRLSPSASTVLARLAEKTAR